MTAVIQDANDAVLREIWDIEVKSLEMCVCVGGGACMCACSAWREDLRSRDQQKLMSYDLILSCDTIDKYVL